MKYLALLALTFGIAAAQSPPKCVQLANAFAACPKACIDTSAPKFNCKAGDLTCMCNNLTKIQADSVGCVTKCQGADVGALLTQAKGVCSCVTSGGAR